MSEQPEASSKPAEPKLCKMGCGFFGSNVTGDCCSTCWALIKPKDDATTKNTKEESGDASGKAEAKFGEKSQDDSAETAVPPALGTVKSKSTANGDVTAAADHPSPAKKKKKKAMYKSMMAGMLEGSSKSRDVEKEKEKLKEVTGGGHFQKIDKI
mmetsp:Transcript_50557/g.107685  ORF Transcript_50557/g.107685 Transcript_50557/m.107685 type:complete len:155 (-) Transcript_50557:225-689(-)|eukprot:CAMPEP_0172554198 /NCGR_PEP_ID=MMETSP1067-20121228/53608_1 /TAXON_ID=265564 ORGANISM="Thalassiosira punctigera, Strain Tpunct2005C2" /NCGR_SAMPLE_ID=MMETSP1067 /ASSEMBLY_ACC=CAM_ASM_000444 /LENGTH=154 /DNA_ID=CAMNT_0013342523 /DNA_START=126 /DNA_END=590 /DNA_ORIENTATION=-